MGRSIVGNVEMMRISIRDRIKQFSSNIDLMYQMIDKKIGKLIEEISTLIINDEQIKKQNKIKE
jgi:hypothetical protein